MNTLVSIIVVTYNSSTYVIETLDSVLKLKYREIELIVSDDASTDSTISVCNDWISLNEKRFVKVKVLMSNQNKGIPANCNKGLYVAEGEFVKYIAGDDILLPNCINDNLHYCLTNDISFLFSKYITFSECGANIDDGDNFLNQSLSYYTHSPKEQYRNLVLYNCFPNAVTSFIRKSTLIDLGGFDERIPLCEDYPLWIKATRDGYKLNFLNKDTVKYRMHGSNVTSSDNRPTFYIQMRKVFFLYRFNVVFSMNPFIGIDLTLKYLFTNYSIWSKYLRILSPYNLYKFAFNPSKKVV